MDRRLRLEPSRWLATAFFVLCPACAGKPPTPAEPSATAAVSPRDAMLASEEESIVELPHSPLGILARSLVDAVNTGKVEAQREFVRTHFSAKGLKEAPIEDWTAFMRTMWAQSGGIDVVAVVP